MSKRPPIDPTDHVRRADVGRVAAILSCNLLGVAMVAAINPALPQIAAHFSAVSPDAAFIARLALLLPAILVALGSPLAGWLASRWGRRPLFLASTLLYGASGGLCLIAPTIESLVALRLVQGLAVAGLVNLAVILGADYFTGAARIRVIGWQAAAINAGGASMLLLSGVLARLSWQAPFILYVVGAAALFALGVATVVEPATVTAPGAAREPLPRTVRLAILLSALTAMLLFLPPIHVPFLLAAMHVGDPRLIGACLAALNVAGMVVALGFGGIARRVGFTAIFVAAMIVGGIGAALIATAAGFAQVTLGALCFGATIGLMVPNLQALAIAASSAAARPRAVSLVVGATFVGEAVSPLLSEPVRHAAGVQGLFGVAAALFIGVAGLAVALRSELSLRGDDVRAG